MQKGGVAMPKKIPQRQCVGCREMKDKKALLRVVKSAGGRDPAGLPAARSRGGARMCVPIRSV